MAFNISKLPAYTVPVSMQFGGQTLKCHVSPEVYASEEFRKEMNLKSQDVAEKEGEVLKTDYSDYDFALSSVITEWDAVDNDGNKVPVDIDVIKGMWWQVKVALWDLIVEALSPKALTRSTLPTSSARKGR